MFGKPMTTAMAASRPAASALPPAGQDGRSRGPTPQEVRLLSTAGDAASGGPGRRGRSPILLAGALLALAGFLAACGGDDDGGGGGDEAASADGGGGGGGGEGMEDAALEFAECMRENGIDMPDPQVSDGRVRIGGGPGGGGGGMDPNSEEFQAAQAECQPILDEAGAGQGQANPERAAEMRDRVAALGDCMRSRGHDDFQDPEVNDSGGITMTQNRPPGGDEDQFQTDLDECEEEAGMGDIQGGGGG
jgi:hypothetical protein